MLANYICATSHFINGLVDPFASQASAAGILPRLQNLSNEAALCGAPAGNLCEEEESEKAKPSGMSCTLLSIPQLSFVKRSGRYSALLIKGLQSLQL